MVSFVPRHGLILVLLVAFLLGAYVMMTDGIYWRRYASEETFETPRCPDVLVQRGNKYVLMVTEGSNNEVEIQEFDTLAAYEAYVDQQRNAGKWCPTLFARKENNAQGQDVYQVYPSAFEVEGGLPRVSTPYGTHLPAAPPSVALTPDGGYAGFDPYGQYVGVFTDLDARHEATQREAVSENPMDPNWGGVGVTAQAVADGKYAENEVNKVTYPKPVGTLLVPPP
jgi:hypothetical protein